jgi:hypothetical protein
MLFGHYYSARIDDTANNKFILYQLSNFDLLHPDSWASIVNGIWSGQNGAGYLARSSLTDWQRAIQLQLPP